MKFVWDFTPFLQERPWMVITLGHCVFLQIYSYSYSPVALSLDNVQSAVLTTT